MKREVSKDKHNYKRIYKLIYRYNNDHRQIISKSSESSELNLDYNNLINYKYNNNILSLHILKQNISTNSWTSQLFNLLNQNKNHNNNNNNNHNNN